MTTSFLILSIGALDLIRPRRRAVHAILLACTLLALTAIAVFALGVSYLVAAAELGMAIAWHMLMPRVAELPTDRTAARLWPVAVLTVLLVGSVLAEPFLGGTTAPAEAFWASISSSDSVLGDVDLTTALAALAVGLFLVQSGNTIVRAALGPVSSESSTEHELPRRGRKLDLFRAAAGTATDLPVTATRPTLQGGRLIGPLERILIVGMAFSGMSTVIAAVIAAKGIVRFPEISNDRGNGSKAEEFLVGTLTSCALAAAGGVYLFAVSS